MNERVNLGKLPDVLEVPDLMGIQIESYNRFFQPGVPLAKRQCIGFEKVLREIFPIESLDQECSLDYVNYELAEPRTDQETCCREGGIYGAPLYITFRVTTPSESKEERVFMGDIPLMTEAGSFIINGVERVIVSQLHRSPGIYFERLRHASGRSLYSFRIIPDRGSWMEVQFDVHDMIYIFLDRRRRRRRFLMSTFLRALGYESNRELLDEVYGIEEKSVAELKDVEDPGELYLVESYYEDENKEGEPLVESLEGLTADVVEKLSDTGIDTVEVVDCSELGDYFVRCVQQDPSYDTETALKEIYRRLRPGDPPNVNSAKQLLKRLFFDAKRYNLGDVGRFKINQKLGLDVPSDTHTIVKEDLIGASAYLMKLRNGKGEVDDIDHLGNRRIRTVGEQMENHARIGLLRTERLVREQMTLKDVESEDLTPGKLINPKAFAGVMRDFFARNQLSQFLDQTNCLSETTNKRRLSALGPGGLTREHAGFEVRDIHPSHYGRICPIETPEGPNIGLITSLAAYGRVNELGFIETPYRVVREKQVTDEVEFLTADKEENHVIVQANTELTEDNQLKSDYVLCRYKGEFGEYPADSVSYMDVSPKQLISAASGLIPFLEHDDANRALMGSNMQRQAVPPLQADSPFVGTGMEGEVAKDSRSVEVAKEEGIVAAASSEAVVVTPNGELPKDENASDANRYSLTKYLRSNASTVLNQKPVVRTGDKVEKGQVLADGVATQNGELALGKNVSVAFMPWGGYNFEDAITVSERLVKDDVYTSIHVDEFEITARDTKLGPEEITRDIPNVGEALLRNLDHEGIIREGAEVEPGDILVGKITPKSETELAPEERLLRAIFGEKAADVKDSSLYVPGGITGIIMDVRVERRPDPTRQRYSEQELKNQLQEAESNYESQYNDVVRDLADELAGKLLGAKLPADVTAITEDGETAVLIPANRKITKVMLKRVAQHYDSYEVDDKPTREQIEEIVKQFTPRFRDIKNRRDDIVTRLKEGKGVEPGIVKSVKVYIAKKRKIRVGDKLAGRHGNKGVISTVVPEEDMPFSADGTPVDMVLSPLGVPSRMNVGQLLETHLGWAARMLDMKVASPVFDGASADEIKEYMRKARKKAAEEKNWKQLDDGRIVDQQGRDRTHVFVNDDGKTVLYEGSTGEPFDQRVVVGEIYMLKLHHMVSDKLHARAVGPYSLVTQQPLGGKAQHGGQRFGEMEVWALEAYGAAYTLQEMLTVKSDDVQGRTKIYESMMKGENTLDSNVPESFNVLMKELQSLCLDVRVHR